MITKLMHRIVALPRVYDTVQFLVGASEVRRRTAERIAQLGRLDWIIDIGGGTGAGREVVPADAKYLCLDIDPMKIAGFVHKNPGQMAIVGDATQTPIASASVDLVICMLMAHHLEEDLLGRMLRDARRILKPTGHLAFIDPIWDKSRWAGRVLWRYDRGSYPRTVDKLREMIGQEFELEHWETFRIWHAYVLGIGKPRVA